VTARRSPSSRWSLGVAAQRPTPAAAWRLEDSVGLACTMMAVGLTGGVVELASTALMPRLVLYAVVLALGAFGLVRRHRRAQAVPG